MPQPLEFGKTARRTIRDFLREKYGDRFRAYFIGDPIVVNESLLPAIAVDHPTSSFNNDAMQHDSREQVLIIRIIFSKKDDFGKNDEEVGVDEKLELFVEGTTGVTLGEKEYHPDSLMYVLRTNLTLGNFAVNQIGDASYDPVPRNNGEVITSEAQISLTIEDIIPVPNRN